MRRKPADTAAVVVTYHPTESNFRNLRSLADQLEAVFVVDNTPGKGGTRYFQEAKKFRNIHISKLGANIGIGAALNIGIGLARNAGYKWAFTFDQDSFLAHGAAMRMRNMATGPDTAILAPLLRDAYSQSPFLRKSDEWFRHEHQVVITSGNLVRISAWESVKGYDWQMFIDMVDIDFCFRLARKGWQIIRVDDVHMVHRLGKFKTARLFSLYSKRVRTYPPMRRYFQARNGITLLRRHGWFARIWSFEYILRLILMTIKVNLIERESTTAWKRGLVSGLRMPVYKIAYLEPASWQVSGHTLRSPRGAKQLAQDYKKRLEELSTFSSF
jgi:rhamnosyltransferase